MDTVLVSTECTVHKTAELKSQHSVLSKKHTKCILQVIPTSLIAPATLGEPEWSHNKGCSSIGATGIYAAAQDTPGIIPMRLCSNTHTVGLLRMP